MTQEPVLVPRELADALSAWAAGADDVTSPLAIAVAKHLRRALFTSHPADDSAGLTAEHKRIAETTLLPHFRDLSNRTLAAISALQQRIGELEAENARLNDDRDWWKAEAVTALAERQAAEQQIVRLTEAAETVRRLEDQASTTWGLDADEIEQLGRARAALQEPQPCSHEWQRFSGFDQCKLCGDRS